MSEQDTNQHGGMPPKQSPFKPIQPAAGAKPPEPSAAPRTVVLKRPGGLTPAPSRQTTTLAPPAGGQDPSRGTAAQVVTGPVPAGIVLTHEQAAKKMTARIDISSATAPIVPVTAASRREPAPPPKTIRLRSPSKAAAPAPAPAPTSAPASSLAPVQPPVTKSKTSRITLDTALSSAPSLPSHAAPPKTIRLKRPGDMAPPSAPRVPVMQPTTSFAIPQLSPATDNVTGVSLAPPAGAKAEPPPQEEPSPTRRKTIKVKRPGAGAAGHKLTLNKDAAQDTEPETENLQDLSVPDFTADLRPADKVGPAFIAAAVIAIIISLDLAWVLAAQAFGPNAAVADFARISGPSLPTPPGARTVNY